MEILGLFGGSGFEATCRKLKMPSTHLPELFTTVQEAPWDTRARVPYPTLCALAEVWWWRLIHGVLGRRRDFVAYALKRGHRALQKEWVGMATGPGLPRRSSQMRNGEVPFQFQYLGSGKGWGAQRGGRLNEERKDP